MKMKEEEEMKTKEEEEEEHLTRFHLQVRKKTETLVESVGPWGPWESPYGVRVGSVESVESVGPWSPWSPRAPWARIGPIPESEVKIQKRFSKKGSKVPKITWYSFPQGSQVKVFQDSQAYIHCKGPHKLPK